MTKTRLDSFAQKISPSQTEQLIEWLADHSYSEVRDFIAAEPPDGFGMDISIPTISRFYKAHLNQIRPLRQERLDLRAAEQQLYSTAHNQFYRSNLNKGYTLSLQERLYEFLSRPVETIDELKKLVFICKEVKNLEIPLDPEEEAKDEAYRKLRPHPFDRLIPGIVAKAEALRASQALPSPGNENNETAEANAQ